MGPRFRGDDGDELIKRSRYHIRYRLIVQRDGARVRLFTRRGFDWSDRFPLISEAERRLRTQSFVIDGEAVWLDDSGLSPFDRAHPQKHFRPR